MLQFSSPGCLNCCFIWAFMISHVASNAPRNGMTSPHASTKELTSSNAPRDELIAAGSGLKFQTADLELPDWHKSRGQTARQKVMCPSLVQRSARAFLGRLVKSGLTVPGAASVKRPRVKRSPRGLVVQLFFSNSSKLQQVAANWDMTSAHAQGRLPYVDAIVSSYKDSADDLLQSETPPETVPEIVGETSGANETDLPPDVLTEWKDFHPEVSMPLSKRMLPLGEGIVGTLISPPSRKCQMNTYRVKVSLAGCVTTMVVATVCSGQCHSRSVPHWTMTSTRMLRHCTCCSPERLVTVPYELSCPGRVRKRLVVSLTQPLYCSCRPCDQTDQ
ncbi:uncharacterized protein LOC131956884 [Physella acuta]|uniref:uncharacterized protein LOC131956884 n=1 Tax=Physella acuta TaxID=109671 RepID=UPI0027DDBAAD|nr:uncharacterized protein LOC131956884 [Physella acuta]